jgi:DNA-binding GntR family transcriptional regulator
MTHDRSPTDEPTTSPSLAAVDDEGGKTAWIVRTLQREIEDGTIPIGQRLPGKRDLAERFGVADNTALAAVKALANSGYAITRARSGSFASKPRTARPLVTQDNLLETVAALVQTQAELLEQIKDLRARMAALSEDSPRSPRQDA